RRDKLVTRLKTRRSPRPLSRAPHNPPAAPLHASARARADQRPAATKISARRAALSFPRAAARAGKAYPFNTPRGYGTSTWRVVHETPPRSSRTTNQRLSVLPVALRRATQPLFGALPSLTSFSKMPSVA